MKTLLLSIILLSAVNSYSQDVTIPDANFKAYLVGNALINTNGDSEIQVSEAAAFTGGLYGMVCSTLVILDLTGIEAFTALTELDCTDNQLTSLDVSSCTALKILLCNDNQLTSLDVSSNTALEEFNCNDNQLTSLDVSNNNTIGYLNCHNNQLTSLDVSSCTALFLLSCHNNQLTSLDVSSNTALNGLFCESNQLTSLDVSSNTVFNYLKCNNNQLECLNVKNGNNTATFWFFAFDNPNLTCIEVDDVNYSTTNWTQIDSQVSFSADCNNGGCTLNTTELNNTSKQLIKIVDLMGRETTFKPSTPLIYIYSDGTLERVFKLEQ
ncbi:hypothetical protein N8329_00310 [Crocinitomicaceae bacterium]|nr:hypothetical protein [Crocinitomicaceae bacterium]